MFFECFRGKLFDKGKRYVKSETTIQKALEERIPNCILHVQFERKTSISQSNLLYPIYGVYAYNYLKQQKMSTKCFKIFTLKWHRKQQHFVIHSSLQCILFVEKNFFVANKLTRAYLKWGDFQLCPLLGPPSILTGPNWHMHNLAMGPTI